MEVLILLVAVVLVYYGAKTIGNFLLTVAKTALMGAVFGIGMEYARKYRSLEEVCITANEHLLMAGFNVTEFLSR